MVRKIVRCRITQKRNPGVNSKLNTDTYAETAKFLHKPFYRDLAESLLRENKPFAEIINALWSMRGSDDFRRVSVVCTRISRKTRFLNKCRLFDNIPTLPGKIHSLGIKQ
jgi:hypothetical protein